MNYRLTINKHKRICDLILAFILLLVYLILSAIKVSSPRHVIHHHYKEIDWKLFNTKTRETAAPRKTFPVSNIQNDNYSETENIIVPNFDFIDNEKNSHLALSRRKYNALKVPVVDEDSQNKINAINTDVVAQFPKLSYSGNKTNLPKYNFPYHQYEEGPRIQIDDGLSFYMG